MADSSYGIWEASTNLVTNGGAETDTTGWTAYGSGVSMFRSTAQSKFGSASFVVNPVFSIDSGLHLSSRISVSANTVYSLSAWIINLVSNGNLHHTVQMDWYTSGGSLISSNSSDVIVLDGAKTRLSVTATSPATAATVDVVIFQNAFASAGNQFHVDGIQLEQKSWATPYIETNGSTAVRDRARVQIPVLGLTATQGWAAFRTRLDAATVSGGTFRGIFFWSNGAGGFIRIIFNTGDYSIQRTNGTPATATINMATSDQDIVTIVGYWTSTGVGISVNGSVFTTAAGTDIPSLPSLFDVGSEGLVDLLNGEILWALFGVGTLTDADAATIHANGDTDPTFSTTPGSPILLWKAVTNDVDINEEIYYQAAVAKGGIVTVDRKKRYGHLLRR